MRQMLVRTQRMPTGDTIGRVVLEARAGQVPHIYGYRMDLVSRTNTGFADGGDQLTLVAALLAVPRWTSAVPIIGDSTLDGLSRMRGLIGLLAARKHLIGVTANGPTFDDWFVTTGWMPCDFPVPGVWVGLQNSPVDSTPTGMLVLHLLFDWVNSSPLATAALYTGFGIDAVDAVERQATGEVDFNRMISEGSLPPLVG